jgi:DNA polymerase III alpha subunit
MDFTIEGDNIRYGLLSIKGISEKSIERINEFKNEYSNKFDIFQAAEDAKVNLGVLCALLQAGSLDGYYSQSRSKMVYEAQIWNILTVREKKWVHKFAEEYNYDLIKIIRKLINFQDEKGKVVIKDSRVLTMRKKADPYKEIYSLNSKEENFASWYYETFLLGYSYTTTLREIFKRDGASRLTCIHDAVSNENDVRATVAGVVEQSISRISKNNNKYLKLVLGDETGKIEVMLFSKKIDACIRANTRIPKVGDIVIVKGLKKHGDVPVVWADVIGIQSLKVYTKLSQLKKKS